MGEHMRMLGLLGLVLLPRLAAAAADEAPPPDDTLERLVASRVAVGSSRARPPYATPSTVSVIDRTTILRFGFRTLGEALETVAGMQNLRTTSRQDVITARGVTQDHYVNKVLLMIDGTPVWNPVVGEAKLSRIALAEVERIEVLRGPASVPYGTNAYSGAINVVLRRLDEAGSSIAGTVGLGDAAETHGSLTALTRSGAWSASFFADFQDEAGLTETVTDAASPPVTGTVHEARRASSVTATLSWRDEHTFTLQAFRTAETKWGNRPAFVEGGLGDPLYYNGLLAVYQLHRRFGEAVMAVANLGYDETDYLFSRGYGFNPRTSVCGWRAWATAGADFEVTDWLGLELSATAERRTSERYHSYSEAASVPYADRDGNLHDKAVDEESIAAQLDLQLFPFALLAGVRLTFNELYGSNLSPRATALWSFASGHSLKLIAGHSYRAPSLFELHFVDAPAGAPDRSLSGNPKLSPETATSLEAAYAGQAGGLSWQALAYWARYANKIARVDVPADTIFADGQPAGVPARQYQNQPGYDAVGAELELRFSGGPVEGFASYTLVDRRSGGAQYTPAHKLSVGPSVTVHELTFAAVFNAWSATDGGAAGTARIGAQLLVDVTASYVHSFGGLQLRHTLAVKDLLDRQVLVPDYVDRKLQAVVETPGRRVLYTLGVDL